MPRILSVFLIGILISACVPIATVTPTAALTSAPAPTGTDTPPPAATSQAISDTPTVAASPTPYAPKPFPKTGEQIAFIRIERNQPARVIAINADGTNETVIAEAAGTEALALVWNWDGSKLAYIVLNNGSGDLHLRDLVNGGDLLLPNINAQSVDWSPDGTLLVFSGSNNGQSGVFVIAADGSGLNRIAERGTQVTWSGRGDIAFIDGDDIYLTDSKGTTPKNITTRAIPAQRVRVIYYAWNASGSKIIFTGVNAQGSGQYIYMVNQDGANRALLSETLQGSGSNDFSPTFSLDTTRVAFYSDRTGAFELYVMRVDGSGLRQLTKSGSQTYNNGVIRFNTRGDKIAFEHTEKNGRFAVFVVNNDGKGLIKLANSGAPNALPRWRP